MKSSTRLLASSAVAFGVLGLAAGPAFAAEVVGETTLSGSQVVSEACQKTTVNVTTGVKGIDNDKDGKDEVVYEVWDDGELKASYHLWVPVGSTVTPTVVLSFSGLYGLSAPGVGVDIIDPQTEKTLFSQDPYIPPNVDGSCDPSAPPTATTSTPAPPTSTSTAPTSTAPTSTAPTTTAPTTTAPITTGPPIVTDGPGSDGGSATGIAFAVGGASLLGAAAFGARRLRKK